MSYPLVGLFPVGLLLLQEALEPSIAAPGGTGLVIAVVSALIGMVVGGWLVAVRMRSRMDERASEHTLDQMRRQQDELSFRLEELKHEQAKLEHRRRVLSETNEMLGMQKEELEEQTRMLARTNQELERMEQLNAWQQEELSERNAALERQTTEAERLSAELAERVEELDRAMSQIDRMYREQESFLRHELGNAIVPIQGYSEMLLAAGGIDGKVKERVHMIRQASERMASLLDVLRNLQAIERGDRAVVRAHIDLDALVKEALHGADPEGTVPVEVSVEPVVVRGDPALLPGVFLNLIRNAVEHVEMSPRSDGNGVRQEDGAGPRPLRGMAVSLFSESGFAVAKISNTGPPVPPDRLKSFFERFNSTKPGGTGLGTSYAKLVVEAHGGDISVSSNYQEGTVVTVRLPIREKEGTDEPQRPSWASAMG